MPALGVAILLGLLASATAQSTLELSLEKTRYDVNEDDGSVIVRVIASQPVPQITIVTIQLSDDSAVSGLDYLQAGSLTTVFLVGVTHVDFTITILNDNTPEFQDKKFNVALVARDGYELGQTREAAVYIKDDDALSLSLDQDHYNISEGGGSVAVRVVSSQPAMDDTMVFLLVSDGSAVNGTDYHLAGTMAILLSGIQLTSVLSEGESEVEFTIGIVDDSIPEVVEEFNVALVAVNYAVGDRSEAVVYIQDDDVSPSVDPEPVSSLNPNGSATITWDAVGGLTYQCSLDDGSPVVCQPGYIIPEEELPLANHVVKVTALQGGEQVGSGGAAVQTCKRTGISPLKRIYLWPSGFVRFKWTAHGNVGSTRCKLDGRDEVDCQSGVRYDLYNLTAGKHAVEVIAYCSANGERISSQQKRFTSQSGIPSDPNCQRMSIQNATAVYNSTAKTISVTFDTSIASICVCKVPAIGQRKQGCESGHVFTGAVFTGKRRRSKMAVVCTSDDCGVKHMLPVLFNLR